MGHTGRVVLVGAGPGDPDLLTVKAARVIGEAEVVVHDRLVSDDIMALVPPTAARLPVGKQPKSHPVPQEEINRLLVRLAEGGLTVVRLKGGDPFVFGRGGEEADALARAGISFEVVPGITAAQGCAASANIPLTQRGMATGMRYLTGHCRDDEPLDADWDGLADPNTTLVIYMGFSQIAQIAAKLIGHGMPPQTPVAVISNGTRPEQRVVRSNLSGCVAAITDAGLSNPLTIIIGEVAGLDLAMPEQSATIIHLADRETRHAQA